MEASWTALWTILGEARECKERKHFECITHVGYACTNWRRYHAAQRGAWAVMLFAKVSSAISSGSSVSRAATTRIIEALSIVVPGYQGEGWSRASLSLSLSIPAGRRRRVGLSWSGSPPSSLSLSGVTFLLLEPEIPENQTYAATIAYDHAP